MRVYGTAEAVPLSKTALCWNPSECAHRMTCDRQSVTPPSSASRLIFFRFLREAGLVAAAEPASPKGTASAVAPLQELKARLYINLGRIESHERQLVAKEEA